MTQAKRGFQVGERVAVYDQAKRRIGEVNHILPDGSVRVNLNPGYYTFHPKQLRRLKPKTNPAVKVAREFWIYANTKRPNWDYGVSEKPVANSYDRIFHVREVLEGSVQVTRESLEKAWDNAVYNSDHNKFGPSLSSITFSNFLRSLGLEGAEK